MDALEKTLLVWAIFAAVLGPLLSRSSVRREPIYGGLVAQVLHFVGVTAMAAVVPAIIAALVFGGGFRLAFPFALILMLTSLFFMVLFAIIERPALQTHESAQEDRGWTEADARSSGL